MHLIDKILDMFRGSRCGECGDEVHEKMKEYAYHSEVGHVRQIGKQFTWVQDRPESFQKPNNHSQHLNEPKEIK